MSGGAGRIRGSLRYRRGDAACASAADAVACDDENPCTTSDACAAGRCVGVAPDVCPAAGQCQVGVCNPLTGACDVTFEAVGNTCDDGDGCTVFDSCFTQLCVPGPPRNCEDFDPCTNEGCVDGACTPTPVECPASSDPCLAGVCRDDSSQHGCGFVPVPGCCHVDADCNDHDFCTRDACDPATHRCANDPLACWLLAGTTTTTVSAQGQSQTRRSRFNALLLVDETRRYRLPDFAGCDATSAVDELGLMVPARAGRTRLVPDNLEDERAAFLACAPSLRLRRRTAWVRVAADGASLRGAFGLHGGGRFRGVSFTADIAAHFKGRPVAHVAENALRSQ